MPDRQNLVRAVDLALAGDWDAAHKIVQEDEDDATSCWIHAVLHKIEGDAGNSPLLVSPRRPVLRGLCRRQGRARRHQGRADLLSRASLPDPTASCSPAARSASPGAASSAAARLRRRQPLQQLGREPAQDASRLARILRPDTSAAHAEVGRRLQRGGARDGLLEAAVPDVVAQPAGELLVLRRVHILHADDDAQALRERHLGVALPELLQELQARAWRGSRALPAPGRNRLRAASTPSAPTGRARCRSA